MRTIGHHRAAGTPSPPQDDAELPEELDDLDRAQQAPAAPISDGRFSPRLLPELGREDLALVIEEEDDASQLAEVRHRARRSMPKPTQPDGAATSAASLVEIEARKGMGSGEARFSFEVPLEDKVEWWHDKYRPRKPKYFNRVHTGYEWNKYNQTHYDHDNPPPKMVQGYKFNIFYPDLIDRSKTPSYSLLPDPSGATDTCLLRFHGGAPYEDIAFKIVNQEWETSHKRGFRCKFERGILQLYFNFKRCGHGGFRACACDSRWHARARAAPAPQPGCAPAPRPQAPLPAVILLHVDYCRRSRRRGRAGFAPHTTLPSAAPCCASPSSCRLPGCVTEPSMRAFAPSCGMVGGDAPQLPTCNVERLVAMLSSSLTCASLERRAAVCVRCATQHSFTRRTTSRTRARALLCRSRARRGCESTRGRTAVSWRE